MEEASQDSDEEVLVMVQFSGVGVSEVICSDPPPSFKIVGLESNEPVIQIGPQFYTGKVENTDGTNLFFQTQPFDPDKEYKDFDKDLQVNPDVWVEYFGKSCKMLNAVRIFPKRKSHDDSIESKAINFESAKNEVELDNSETVINSSPEAK